MLVKIKPESKKFTHDQVGYEDPSTHQGERCKNCEHFIPATDNNPAGCEGVQRPIAPSAWCHRYEKDKDMKHAGHGYTDVHVEHHDDGTHTAEFRHESGDGHHKKHGLKHLDELHDRLEDHLRHPNNEEELEEKVHPGIHNEIAEMAKGK